MSTTNPAPLDPSPILQTAFGFWNAKVLLTAVELRVFEALAERPLTAGELGRALGLHPRGARSTFSTRSSR